jgi:DNA-binding NtrC family response regulator
MLHPVWAYSPDGRLVYISSACGRWLGVDPETLIGLSVASANDDRLVEPQPYASLLAPPAGLMTAAKVQRVYSPQGEGRDCLFVPLSAEDGFGVLAIADVGVAVVDHQWSDYERLIDGLRRHLAQVARFPNAVIALGTSLWARKLARQIEVAGATGSHVVLLGPQGSGQEIVARMIHALRAGNAGPFVAIEGPLMDGELLDASTSQIVAHLMEVEPSRATIFVRDIEQMPGDAQQRLELLLANFSGRLTVIASTTRGCGELLPALTASLATAITEYELEIAPLAARVEDIPLLASALLQRRRLMGETRAAQISREVLDRLVIYPWPGNYDELVAAIRNAARQCRGETLQMEHLPLAIRTYGGVREELDSRADKEELQPLDELLAETEKNALQRALTKYRGNRAAAARALGITRSRFLRRQEQLGVRWPNAN